MRIAYFIPTVLVVLLAGCTSSSPTPPTPTTATDNGVAALSADQIVARAQTALGQEKSYRIKGDVANGDQTTSIDLQNGGQNVKGTLALNGQTLEILRTGNDLYLKASDAFWKNVIPAEQQSALAMLSGKYVKVDATNESFGVLTEAFDPSEILKVRGTVAKGASTTVNGTPAIGVVSEDEKATLFVATVGQPRPLRITGDMGDVEFTDFGETIEFTPPASSEVFDLKSLK